MVLFIYIVLYNSWDICIPIISFEFTYTQSSRHEVKTMAYLFITVSHRTNTMSGTCEMLTKCLLKWSEGRGRKTWRKGREWYDSSEKRLMSMEIQKIVLIFLCAETSLNYINIQFSHIYFVLRTKLQVLQRGDLLNIGIRRCSLHYF